MPFNGSGDYSAPSLPGSFNPAVTGSTATASDWNTFLADLSDNGLSKVICVDGQSTITADIPFNSYKITELASAASSTDAVNAGQISNSSIVAIADTGAADAYAISPAVAIASYAAYQRFQFVAANANTGASTLEVSGLAAKDIKNVDGSALAANQILAGAICDVQYDGTQFILLAGGNNDVFLKKGGTVSAAVTFTGGITATAGTNNIALATGSSAVTETQATNSTKVATTAYVDRVGVQQVVTTQTGAVNSGSTAMPWDDTIPQNTEGDEYMTRSITPKSATSKLVIDVVFNYSLGSADVVGVALFQDSTADALAVGQGRADNSNGGGTVVSFQYVMTSGTTSATTFKVRAGSNGGTALTFNGAAAARKFGGVFASSITITEIGI